jgi:hypothetical protein
MARFLAACIPIRGAARTGIGTALLQIYQPGADKRIRAGMRLLIRQENSETALNKLHGNTSIFSGAKALVDFEGFTYGLKPVPFKTSTSSEVPTNIAQRTHRGSTL